MKNILLLIILLLMLLNSLTYPQSQYPTNSKNIESKIDSLEHLKAILQNEIIKIDSTISILDEKKIQLEFSKFKSNKLFITSSKNLKAEFRSAPVLHPANVIATIPTNTKLEVLGADENDFLKLIFKNKEGYVLRFLTNIDDKQYNVLKSNYLLKLEVQKIRLDSLISEIEIDRIWVKSYTANVRQEPSSSAKIFIKLEQGEEIYKQKSMNGWIKIKFRNPNFSRKDVNTIDDIKKLFFEGWIYNNLTSNSKIKKIGRSERYKIDRKLEKEKFLKNNPGISYAFKQGILNDTILIGMSKDMIILIKGEPDDINRTVTAGIVYEQWIYPSYEYLYFENNILSSWQN